MMLAAVTTVDWLVFAAFMVWVVADGMRRTRQAGTLEHYFAAGRTIPWWAAGLSVMATQASAVTVVGTTGQGYVHGMEFVQFYFALPLAMVVLCAFLVPLLRRQPILTAYQYLEHRFGPKTRTGASLIFLLSRCLAVGGVIYAAAVVLSVMLPFGLITTTLIIGVLTTVYTVAGGVSAVIWTDVKQMTVILGGLLLCLVLLLWNVLQTMDLDSALRLLGSAGKLKAVDVLPAHTGLVPRWSWQDGGTPSFWEDKYNLWSGTIGTLFLFMAYFGCDQSQVQRILTNPTARESRLSLLVSAVAKVPMQTAVLGIGALMYLLFVLHQSPVLYNPDQQRLVQEQHAEEWQNLQARYRIVEEERRAAALQYATDGDEGSLARFRTAVRDEAGVRHEALELAGGGEDTNFVFTYFMLQYLPPIALGLILAAVFAAAMSSVDSALNALSSSTIVDLYQRWLRPRATEVHLVRASRWATVFWGALGTGTAAWIYPGNSSVIERINEVGAYFYGSLLGVFVLAATCKRGGDWTGVLGLAGGMAAVVATWQLLRVEWLWLSAVGCLGVLIVGSVVSLVERPRPA